MDTRQTPIDPDNLLNEQLKSDNARKTERRAARALFCGTGEDGCSTSYYRPEFEYIYDLAE